MLGCKVHFPSPPLFWHYMMSRQRISTICRHLSKSRPAASGYSTAPTAAHYVPQYSNADHPVLKCRKRVSLLDSYMSYLDTGVGKNTVVFVHGNPSSAYLWRNVILQVKDSARCLAPDLLGHGLSGKEPNHNYRLEDQYKYFSAWIDYLKLPEKFSLVVHDWGAGVGLYWANKNRHRIQSLVYFEAAIAVAPTWDKMSPIQQEVYGMMRSPRANDFMASPENGFMDSLMRNIQRKLEPEEEAVWKAPFEKPGEDRRPIVTWCREVPIKGDGPNDVIQIFNDFRRWLSEDKAIPKLYIDISPGMLAPNNRAVTRKWHNQKVAKARGLHFAQEDDPVTIGNEINNFLNESVYK